MAFSQRFEYETLRSADTASASTNLVLGTKLEHPAAIVKVVNLSNKNLVIVKNGIDVDICPAGGYYLYDQTANSTPNGPCFLPAGTQFAIRTTDAAAGTGLAYLVVQYIVTN